MPLQVVEPKLIDKNEISDDTAGNFTILVYKKASENAGIKQLGLLDWKSYIQFKQNAVYNLGTLIGYDESEYLKDEKIDPTQITSLKTTINIIVTNCGVSDDSIENKSLSTRINENKASIDTNTTNITNANKEISSIKQNMGYDGIGDVDLNTKINENQTNIHNLQNKIGDIGNDSLETQLSSINTQITNNNTNITNANNEISSIKQKMGYDGIGDVDLNTNVKNLQTSVNNNTTAISNLQTDNETNKNAIKDILGDIASIFDNNKTYVNGDYVLYSNKLYKCNVAEHTGEWNDNNFIQVNIGDELKIAMMPSTMTITPKQISVSNGTILSILDDAAPDGKAQCKFIYKILEDNNYKHLAKYYEISTLGKWEVSNNNTRVDAIPIFQFTGQNQTEFGMAFKTTGNASKQFTKFQFNLILSKRDTPLSGA